MRHKATAITADRFVFFDHLRMFAVLAVVLLHASMAYAPVIPWWYVLDAAKNRVFTLVLVVTDGFVMPTLFWIAGYFALASLERHGAVAFLRAKLRRLGLPLAVVTVVLCPIIGYVIYLGQGGGSSFLAYWWHLLPTLLDWRTVVLSSSEPTTLYARFSPFHAWFLSLLLLFCGLLAVGRLLAPRLAFGPDTDRLGPGFARAVMLVLVVGMAEAFGQALVADTTWVGLGPFIVCQPARLPLYLGMFLLGCFAWRRGWFRMHRLPGSVLVWGGLVLVAYGCLLVSGKAVMAPGPKPLWMPCVFGLVRTLVAIAVTGGLAVFGQRYWNRGDRVSESLSSASYDIYLAHFPLVVVLQYALVTVALPATAKCAIVFAISTLVCWGASRAAAVRRQLWVPVGVMAAFAACGAVWG